MNEGLFVRNCDGQRCIISMLDDGSEAIVISANLCVISYKEPLLEIKYQDRPLIRAKISKQSFHNFLNEVWPNTGDKND